MESFAFNVVSEAAPKQNHVLDARQGRPIVNTVVAERIVPHVTTVLSTHADAVCPSHGGPRCCEVFGHDQHKYRICTYVDSTFASGIL